MTSPENARLSLVIAPLLTVIALTAAAYVSGRLLTRRLVPAAAPERGPVALALGLAVLAQAALLLGLCGQLRQGPVLVLIAAVYLLGLESWRELVEETRRRWRDLPRRGVVAFAALVFLAASPLAVLAFYPPTAFDATLYHLPYARAFVESGGVPLLPDLRYPVFPQLNELLFAVAFLLRGGETAAHLVQFAATAATAAVVFVWGRQAYSPATGWFAAAVFLGHPIVVGLAASAYVEPVLTLFATAALYAAWRWRESGRVGWLVLAAAFAGSAAGVKYLGLFFVAFLFADAVVTGWRDRSLRVPLLFALVAAAALAPTYGRIFFHTGNPLFPFFSGLFGPSAWEGSRMMGDAPLLDRLERLMTLPWDVLFRREEVGGAPPFSPVWLLAWPLLLLEAVQSPQVKRLLLLVLAYCLSCVLLLAPDARYFTAVLPVACLALGAGLAFLQEHVFVSRRRPEGMQPVLLTVLCAVLFLPGWLYALYRIDRQGPVPVGAEARDRYLARQLALYPAVAWLNRTRGSDYAVYALHAENLVWFAEGRFLGDWIGPASFDTAAVLLRDPPEALYRWLRKLGATHLLVNQARDLELPDTPEARRLFRQVYAKAPAAVYELR